MRNWSLGSRIIFLTFLPALLVSILLGFFFTRQRIVDVNQQFESLGHSIIQQLEPAAKFAFSSGNNTILQSLSDTTMENPKVVAIAFYNAAGKLLAYGGPGYLTPQSLQQFQSRTPNHGTSANLLKAITAQVPSADFSDFYTSFTNPKGIKLGSLSLVITRGVNSYMQTQSILLSIIAIFIALFLSLLLSRFITWTVTRPLTKIHRAISALQHGDFNFRLHGLPGKEFNQIAKDLAKLKVKMQQLESVQFDDAQQETSDLKQTLEKIEIQNIELNIALKNAQRDNRRKSEFIASLSHEIRTPMSSIIGFTNLLIESDLTRYQQEYLVTIQKSANTLLTIINDILDFSKIEAGKFKLESIPFDFNDIIDEVLQSFAPEAQSKQLELIPLVSPDIPAKVIGDPLRLKQILTNLVFNSIKFTGEGSVCIKAEFIKQVDAVISLQISVIDTGIGLSERDKKNLFKAFSQADASIARKFGGTGLGLVISKQFIEQMGGSIEVQSKAGVGSTMRFTLNFTALDNADQHTRYLRKIEKSLLVYEPHLLSRTAIRQCLSAWVQQLMVVDTFESLTRQLATLSKTNGLPDHIVMSLANGSIQDHMAIDVLDFLKSHYDIPVTILANSSHKSDITRFIEHGASNYVLKPLSVKKIIGAIYELEHYPGQESKISTVVKENKPSYHSYQILIAEDNPANLKLITSVFSHLGQVADTAMDGQMACDAVDRKHYDLIFLDLHMPIKTGLEVVEHIRQNCQLNKNTPVIAIGAYIDESEKKELYGAGFNELLMKPVDLTTLEYIIHKWENNIPQHSAPVAHEKPPVEALVSLERTIELSAGSEILAREIIQMFMNELPSLTEKMHSFYRQQQWKQLTDVIHRINGSSRYCAMHNLQQAAVELETALKNGDQHLYAHLYQKISNDILELQEYLSARQF